MLTKRKCVLYMTHSNAALRVISNGAFRLLGIMDITFLRRRKVLTQLMSELPSSATGARFYNRVAQLVT